MKKVYKRIGVLLVLEYFCLSLMNKLDIHIQSWVGNAVGALLFLMPILLLLYFLKKDEDVSRIYRVIAKIFFWFLIFCYIAGGIGKGIEQNFNDKSNLYRQLNTYVDKETFKGDKFSYVVDDGTKICNVEDERYKIQYYAENENGIYAKISECCEDYCVTFTYEEEFIKIRFQNDSSNYWCKVDYQLNAINVDEEIFYNKITSHITEQKMYDINNYFYEYTVSLLNDSMY